jgi:IclR family acetate operon transcriptional repressor
VEDYIEGGLPAVTARTIVDPAALRAELEKIAELGYAICREELEDGVVSVGAAIRRGGGRPLATLSISGPVSRMVEGLLDDYGKTVYRAAESIAAALPAQPEPG